MNSKVFCLLLSLCFLPALADKAAPSDTLRQRYTDASPGERAAIREEINAKRHAAIVARFDADGSGELSREEREVAAETLRREWAEVQAARQAAVDARVQQVEATRDAMLRQRLGLGPSGRISDAQRREAMEAIRREQEAHRQRR